MDAVLAAVDASPMARAALDAGVAFARQVRLPVHLVTAALSDDVVEPLAEWRDELRKLCEVAKAPRSQAHLILEVKPADAILSVAEQLGDVLLCMGTHGRGRVGWALLGSVAEEVVSRSRFPVLLTGPKRRTRMERYERVFVALDGSTCAETVLPLAQRLGSVLGASLTLVSAAGRDGHRGQAQRRLTAAYLRQVADTLTGPAPVETTVLTGDAAKVLVEALPSQGALLVMSTHGRSGSSGSRWAALRHQCVVTPSSRWSWPDPPRSGRSTEPQAADSSTERAHLRWSSSAAPRAARDLRLTRTVWAAFPHRVIPFGTTVR